LAVLEHVDLVVGNLYRDTFGLEEEDFLLPGVDITFGLAR
jgi:hypothetical protein